MLLNLCLDSGSKVSYITRRYRERYALTPLEISELLADHTPLDTEQVQTMSQKLFGKSVSVALLPHDGFAQCDLILGSGFAGLYSTIQFKDGTVNLWHK
ncbi:MAG: hypothetical protein HRU22_10150 [Gammaproteobacteria bacterium]|nr:hypothetical protein [Gammaproteobacteria bacterium]